MTGNLTYQVLLIFNRFVDSDEILADTLFILFTFSVFRNLVRATFVVRLILVHFYQITPLLLDTVHHLVESVHSEPVEVKLEHFAPKVDAVPLLIHFKWEENHKIANYTFWPTIDLEEIK